MATKPKPTPPPAESEAAATGLTVSQEILKGIFNDDPKGVYYSKDGETFFNAEQYEALADKEGYEKFEK